MSWHLEFVPHNLQSVTPWSVETYTHSLSSIGPRHGALCDGSASNQGSIATSYPVFLGLSSDLPDHLLMMYSWTFWVGGWMGARSNNPWCSLHSVWNEPSLTLSQC